MEGRSRFPFRLLALATLVLIVLPLAAILTLHIPQVQTKVIQLAVQKIESTAPVKIQLEGYRWWPFSRLRLINLKIRSQDRDILECERAQLAYQLSWDWPHVVPKKLDLEKPVLHLEKDEKGNWQLPRGKEEERGGSGPKTDASLLLSFPWPKVHISSGSIFAQQGGRSILTLRDMNGDLSFRVVSGPDGPRLKIGIGAWESDLSVPRWGKLEISGEAELGEEALAIASLAVKMADGSLASLQGRLDIRPPHHLALQVSLAPLHLDGFSEVQARLPDLKEVSGSLDVTGRDGSWSVGHDLHTSLGDLNGTATVEVGPQDRMALRWATHFADLSPPELPGIPRPQLFGQMDLALEGRSIETMKGQADIRLESSMWGRHSIRKAALSGTYDQGVVSVKASEIQSTAGDFSLSGSADLGGVWDLMHPGTMKLSLQIDKGRLDTVVTGVREHLGGMLQAEARYGPGDFANWQKWEGKLESRINIPELLSLKASAGYKGQTVDLEYDVSAGDVQQVSAWIASWEGKGRLASRGTLKGKWPDLVWEGSLSSPSLQYGDVKGEQVSVSGKGKIFGKEADRKLSVKAQNLTVGEDKIGSLKMDLDQHENSCRYQVSADQTWNNLSASLAGRVENLWSLPQTVVTGQGQLTWKRQTAAVEAKVEVRKDRIVFHTLQVQQEKQKARLSGELAFDTRSDLRLSVENLDAEQWMKQAGLGNVLAGSVSGNLQLSGRPEQPEMTFNVQLLKGAFAPKGVAGKPPADRSVAKGGGSDRKTPAESIARLELQGSFSSGALQIKGQLQAREDQTLAQLSARVPMTLSLKPARLEVKRNDAWSSSLKVAALDAQRLMPYLPFLLKAGGRFDVDAQAGGTLSQPIIKGSGSWRDGNFTVRDWPHPVENIQLEFQADSKQIQVTRSSMKLLGGQVQVTGKVEYPDFDVLDFEAVGQDLDVPQIYGIEGKASGHARLIQGLKQAHLTGELNLSKAIINLGGLESDIAKNIDIVDDEEKGDVVVFRGDENQKDNYYNRLKMDLGIKLPASGTWVKGRGLEAEIIGSMKLAKEPFGLMSFLGGVHTLRGTYTFQGSKLKIADGDLTFMGGSHPDPILKIVCRKEVRDVALQVQVSGPLSQPKLAMSSVPSMSQVDILSYLLFDQAATDLSSKESSQLQDKAAAWLGSQTSGMLKGIFGNSPLAPDSLQYRTITGKRDTSSQISSPTGSQSSEEGAILEIGKHITPDLSVTYGQGVKGTSENEVKVEYRLNRHLSIQTQVGGPEQTGADVFWRYDFGK